MRLMAVLVLLFNSACFPDPPAAPSPDCCWDSRCVEDTARPRCDAE